jgi:peroxiredoxin
MKIIGLLTKALWIYSILAYYDGNAMPSKSLKEKFATLKIRFINKPEFDSLYAIYFTDYLYQGYWDEQLPKVVAVIKEGYYYCRIPVTDSFVYFKIIAKRSESFKLNYNDPYYKLMEYNYLKAGDSISVTIDYRESKNKSKNLIGRQIVEDFKIKFSGMGAEKCNFKLTLDSLLSSSFPERISNNIGSSNFIDKEIIVHKLFDSVERKTSFNNDFAVKIIKLNGICDIEYMSISAKISYITESYNKKLSSFPSEIVTFKRYLDSLVTYQFQNLKSSLFRKYEIQSPSFLALNYMLLWAKMDIINLNENGSINPLVLRSGAFMDSILAYPKGEMKDRLIVYHFKMQPIMDNFAANVLRSLESTSTPNCKKYLNSLLPNAGTMPAPDFTLKNEFGANVKLSDFRNKVLFIDFWFTGCGNCAVYYSKHLKEVEEYFKTDSDIVFISISTDVNKEQWIESIKSDKYTSRQAINLYTGGKGMFHPVVQKYNVVGFPSLFLINRDGLIEEFATKILYKNQELIARIIGLRSQLVSN